MDSTIRKQQGFSLIEIIIALAISLIIILAILRSYVSLGYVSAESTRGASIDTNIMNGLIVADRILQGVGYNTVAPTDSYGNDKLIQAYSYTPPNTFSPTGLNTVANAFVWKLSNNNCQALVSKDKSLIYYLGVNGTGYSCSPGLALPVMTGLSVTPSQTLISASPAMPNNVDPNVGKIALKITKLGGGDTCTPFGVQNTSAMTPSGGKYYVEITANIYATSTSSTSSTISNSTCLFNIST